MKKFNTIKHFLVLFSFSLAIISCKKDDSISPTYNIKNEVYIVNEGNFGKLNGSISLFNPSNDSIINYIFESANPGKTAGDVVQSMGIANSKGYIISNGTDQVKIVNLNDFKQIAELSISYPRYFLQVSSNKAYITSGKYAGYAIVVDLANSAITDSIPLGNGPENLVKCGQYAYVANCGGWITDSTVSVIDINTDKELTKIICGENPSDLVVDADSDIWVICKGYYDQNYMNGPSNIVKINHRTNTVEKSFPEGIAHDNFESKLLAISNDLKTVYYQEIGGVYAFPITTNALPSEPIISSDVLYGLAVNPNNGDIYCFYSGDFTSAGKVAIYDKTGQMKIKVNAGIGPNGAVFN